MDLGLPEPEFKLVPVAAHMRRLRYARGSRASAESALAVTERGREIVYQRIVEVLREKGPLSDRQMQDLLAISGDTQRPRRLELVELGIVAKYGEIVLNKRKQATWMLTHPGRKWSEWKAVLQALS